MDYNRVLKTLNGMSHEEFLTKLKDVCNIDAILEFNNFE